MQLTRIDIGCGRLVYLSAVALCAIVSMAGCSYLNQSNPRKSEPHPPQRFCREVVEALSARIDQLVQEAKTEDQEAVVTELRAHEQGLLGATPAAAR